MITADEGMAEPTISKLTLVFSMEFTYKKLAPHTYTLVFSVIS